MNYDQRYIYLAAMLKAMGHPTRLFILDRLNERDYSVGELRELVGIDMSTMSRHLAVLKQVKIIDSTKQNNQVIYHLKCPCVLDVYQCMINIR